MSHKKSVHQKTRTPKQTTRDFLADVAAYVWSSTSGNEEVIKQIVDGLPFGGTHHLPEEPVY